MLRGNSRGFDFQPYFGQIYLVFVDGSHIYEDVLSDSRNALKMLTTGGYMLRDDNHPPCLLVAEVTDNLSREIPIKRIAETRLALHGPAVGSA